MPPQRELSQEQIQEIRALRGQLSAAEAKKRFGIGSTRLYKIWRSEPAALPPTVVSAAPPPTAEHLFAQRTPTAPHVVPAAPAQQAPTVEDFYKRLGRLESQVEQSTRLLEEVLAVLEEQGDALLDELEEEVRELRQKQEQGGDTADAILDELEETHQEQTETRTDVQKVGQMVEMAQNWAYLSLAAVLVWKVVGATVRQCTPAAMPSKTPTVLAKQNSTAALPPLPDDAKPGNPFYME